MPKLPFRKRADKSPDQASVIPLVDIDDPRALTPLHFRVPAQFHREFKLFAVQRGMSMVDLLQASFELMKKQR